MPRCAGRSHRLTHFFESGKAIRNLPGSDGSDAERAALERKHAKRIASVLRTILNTVAPEDTTTASITPDAAMERYREAAPALRDALVDMLTDGVLLGVDVGRQQVDALLGVGKAPVTVTGVDWDMVHVAALQWITGAAESFGTGYAEALEQALAQTSERILRPMIAEWMQNELSYRQLVTQLERTVFSAQRAEMLAVTEVTRAYYRGNLEAWQGSRVIRQKRWNTVSDEKVCVVCQPLNQTVVALEESWHGVEPPAHPRCRCWVSPVVAV